MTPQFYANWKMNMRLGEAEAFCEQFLELFTPLPSGEADCGIAPPYTALPAVSQRLNGADGIIVGAQNVHWLSNGAHTGEVSAPMLAEHGVDFAIVGHSERRLFYAETSANVAKRARAALDEGMKAIVCIGETEDQFRAKQTTDVVLGQLRESLLGITSADSENLIIAYEPVWAIGTGLAATPEIARDVHAQIRFELKNLFDEASGAAIPILYGGSTKPENIAELCAQENVNGALVGGSSLKPDVFDALIKAGRAA